MDQRTEAILEAAVRSFIDMGEPISSGWLHKHYDFGIKPAMIRFELGALTDAGYLEQPHHSAGRIPTNRGYEFFADRVLETSGSTLSRTLENLFFEKSWAHFLGILSRELGILGIADESGRENIYKDGLDALVGNLEWTTHSEIREIIRDFESIDDRLKQAEKTMNEDSLNIFIGKKSPVTTSDELAVIMGSYGVDGERVFLFGIGPKRMNYEEAVKIFKGLKQKK